MSQESGHKFSIPISVTMYGKAIDLPSLRDRFLNTPPNEMQTFLQQFRGSKSDLFGDNSRTPADFKEWQTILRWLLREKNWKDLPCRLTWNNLEGHPNREKLYELSKRLFLHSLQLRFDDAGCSAALDPESVLQALLASVLIEKIRGHEFSVCAREGCEQVFRALRGKLYHSFECAHIATVYKGRKAKHRKLIEDAEVKLSKLLKGRTRKGSWYDDIPLKTDLAHQVNQSVKWVTRNRIEIENQRRRRKK